MSYHILDTSYITNYIQKQPSRAEVFCKKAEACNFIKKETLGLMFSCEFCENFKKKLFFIEHLLVDSIQTLFFVIICQFAQSKILKFEDFLHHQNINLVKNSTEKNCPATFNNIFIQTQETHQYNTRGALNNLIDIL